MLEETGTKVSIWKKKKRTPIKTRCWLAEWKLENKREPHTLGAQMQIILVIIVTLPL